MIKVELTHRAMLDLIEINEYSIQEFGQKIAEKYLDDIEAALLLIREQPRLLISKKDASNFFQFYPVRKHHLICMCKRYCDCANYKALPNGFTRTT
jgi:toxin ParE1/3/4